MPPHRSENRCPRCLEPAPPRASRCPHCREPLVVSNRRVMMVVGGIGVLFLALVIAAAVFSKPFEEETDGPQPETEHSQPAPAPKKPPLN